MTHPIIEPLILHLPITALSRTFIEGEKEFKDIILQLMNERKWCRNPQAIDNENRTGRWYLEKNGYIDWLKDAEDEDFVRMVGVLHLIIETFSSLEEDLYEDD